MQLEELIKNKLPKFILNSAIKYRESFRPFAPSIIEEEVSNQFEIDTKSPYMLLVAPVKKELCLDMSREQKKLFGIEKLNVIRSSLPAITHVDYSARIQTVHQNTNPRYYKLITKFKEITGLMEGTAEPDSEKCVEIATTAALKKMMLPGIIAVSMPAIVGFGLGAQALGGMLAGGLLGCVSLALMMANAGGAWDNAKKYVEKGNLGGKGSETHSATVVGDTVGDPFKDTSGPSMNILINVMAIVSLVIAPLLSI